MRFFIGLLVLIMSVFGTFALIGGNLLALYQPGELAIIGGAAIAAFIIANPKSVIIKTLKKFKYSLKESPYSKEDYISVLLCLLDVFKLIRNKGMLAIENDIDNPEESEVLKKYPVLLNDKESLSFLCDYLRVIGMGLDNHYQLDDLMNQEMDTHHEDHEVLVGSLRSLSDGLPAIGIVAAVLGVIKAMSSMSEPPEVLGKLIGGALVGTFLGVFLSYCLLTPIYTAINQYLDSKGKLMLCIKTALIAHMQGLAPIISVEAARKTIPSMFRPSFAEVEGKMNDVPA